MKVNRNNFYASALVGKSGDARMERKIFLNLYGAIKEPGMFKLL